MMKSELSRAIKSNKHGNKDSEKFRKSTKGYPSFMESPSKHLSKSRSRFKSEEEDLENPWDELHERVIELEDDPITDESQIIRDLDETIRSIIQEDENAAKDIQSEEF